MLPLPASGAYVTTMRDTGLPEPMPEYTLEPIIASGAGYELLGEIGYLRFFYRGDRDVIAVEDARNGYTWKTGIDMPFERDIYRAIDAMDTEEKRIEAAVPKEGGLSDLFISMANSLLTVEFFDESHNLNLISSTSQNGARSQLHAVSGEPHHFVLEVRFRDLDLEVKVHIHLTGQGLRYQIFDEEITGEGAGRVAALILTPFLGASGGSQAFFDPSIGPKGDYGAAVRKPMIPGYIMVPDGPGALIRFRENSVSFRRYVGSVYGADLADANTHTSSQLGTVPYKEPLMPVFGVAHGDRQAAFVFWADQGETALELVVSPEGNRTDYNYVYPRFVANQTIYQVYNRRGDGYSRLFPERNRLDIDVTYTFLAGDGSSDGLPADYTGMALSYRAHLIGKGILTERAAPDQMPIHFDFVMSDIKKDVLGYKNMVTTTADDVRDIITDMQSAGITGINAGLMGAQKGGITGGKPWKLSFTKSIGSRGDFSSLLTDMAKLGADVYFTQDYASINSRQMFLGPNMAYHRNSWGLRRRIEFDNTGVPVSEISIARPQKSAEWMVSQAKAMRKAGASSIGIDGVSSRLTGHHGSDPMTAAQAAALLRDTAADLDMTVNAYTPNMYLWDVTDRFINAPLLPTQYIIQTDTVPFLQMVLHGTMEVYGPYANFSFYTQNDVLRMIDYNVYPAFVLTRQPAYLLADTNSSGFYSTSYDLYRDIIIDMAAQMSAVYGAVAGRNWIGREVLQNGVVLNTYSGGLSVLINYTEQAVDFGGRTAPPQSATVREGGGLS
jgi:hypothetical protein